VTLSLFTSRAPAVAMTARTGSLYSKVSNVKLLLQNEYLYISFSKWSSLGAFFIIEVWRLMRTPTTTSSTSFDFVPALSFPHRSCLSISAHCVSRTYEVLLGVLFHLLLHLLLKMVRQTKHQKHAAKFRNINCTVYSTVFAVLAEETFGYLLIRYVKL